ncbi:MAG TPA: DNA recombination/repair protein RecA, partial [Patescibacteria group bacterium]
QKIGVMFGNPETTPGGLALKFYASVRIDVRKIANIKTAGGDPIGSQHRARVIKNKIAPPFKEAEFDIMNTEGISVYGGLVDMGIKYNIIGKSGAFFKVGDQNIQGREGAKKYLKENPAIANEIKDKIWTAIQNPADPNQKFAPIDGTGDGALDE